MTAYHIKQWDLYERADTRKVDFMPWYPKQTKLMGIGIGYTMAQPDNVELLGLWNLLEIFATQSKKFQRGWLVRNGQPLTAAMMASLVPQVPEAKFQRALEHFSKPEVDWLEQAVWGGATNGSAPGTSPGGIPPKATTTEDSGSAPGTSPGELRRAGKNSATDRQTDSTQTDRQTVVQKKSGEVRTLEGSKVIWAALQHRQRELEAKPRGSWSEAERQEWKKNRADLALLNKKQRAGDFTT